MIKEYSSYTPREENCQKGCFLWTLGNHGGDLGYQRAKFYSSRDQGAEKGREFRESSYQGISNFQIPCFWAQNMNLQTNSSLKNQMKQQSQLTPNQPGWSKNVSQSISCAQQQMQSWSRTDLAHRVKMPGSQETRITFLGIILGYFTK